MVVAGENRHLESSRFDSSGAGDYHRIKDSVKNTIKEMSCQMVKLRQVVVAAFVVMRRVSLQCDGGDWCSFGLSGKIPGKGVQGWEGTTSRDDFPPHLGSSGP